MASKFSFDIVSEVDLQEVDNAINQAKREMQQRYDFKGSKSTLELNKQEKQLVITADDEYKLKSIQDMLSGRLIKRNISPRAISYKKEEQAHGGMIRQEAEITSGISKERAKELVKAIKDLKLKVQPQIQDEQIRVTSEKKDALQEVINHVKGLDFEIPLQFENYR